MDAVSADAATPLAVRLLGRFEARVDARPIVLTGRHARALFALLVLQPRIRLRDAIAADLWPDAGGSPSAALRQALWTLRGAIAASGTDPDAVLASDPQTLGLRHPAALDLDAVRFETLVRAGRDRTDEALACYEADLAEDLGNECFAAERERLADLYEDALAEAADARLSVGDLAGAREAASRLIARDPLREEGHATLIAAYGLDGSRSQVMRQYRRLCDVLRGELGVMPLPETDATLRMALARTMERSRLRAAAMAFDPRGLAPVFAGGR